MMFSELTASRLKLTTLAGGVNYRDLLLRSMLVSNVIRGMSTLLILGPDAVSMNTHEARIRSAVGAAYVTHLSAKGGVMPLSAVGAIIPAADSLYDIGQVTHYFNQGWFRDINASTSVMSDKLIPTSQSRIPIVANADLIVQNMRYDPVGNVFEIYDGAAWNPH